MSVSEKELNNTVEDEQVESTCDIIKSEIVHLKWRILAVACFLPFGSYYIYDFPASIGTGDGTTIQTLFGAKNKEYNQAMNQALYSVYSYPNTVLAIFGGLLIDKYIGLRKSMLLFVALVLSGSAFFLLGVCVANYPLMLFARVLFGLGGESLSVAQSAFVARWFRGGRGMALAFGITISFSRVGSSFNFLFSPRIADNWNIQMACVAGVIACFLSLIACIVLIFADIYAVKKGLIKAEAVGNADESGDVMKFKDLLKLPLELWLICAICIFCYCAIFPFVGIAKNYFQVKYNMSGSDASTWISLYQFASAGASPIIGALVDQTGRYTLWLILASCCFIGIHLLFLLTSIPPYVLTATMGLFYSFLVSGLWPSVPFAVSENMCGMAYGIITALQNAGLATFPLITGAILDAYTPSTPNGGGDNTTNYTTTATYIPVPTTSITGTYIPVPTTSTTEVLTTSHLATLSTTFAPTTTHSANFTLLRKVLLGDDDDNGPLPTMEGFKLTEMVFIISAGLSLLSCVLLLIVDKAHGGILSSTPARRKELVAQRDEERRGLLSTNDDGYSPKKVDIV
eukprot:GDKJ01003894.1.p1 GENE.GDKJ01003894.1~~GDKJ01003894.1.p1  ORF type:complete len:571 (-),score=67.61 GDKJ01003894.1:285-1997(-)